MVSHANRRRIGAAVAAYWIGLLVFSMAPAGAVAGQTEPTAQEEALAGAVRERFEVDLRPDGLTLTSTGPGGAARVITLGDGVVAVDGVPVSGLELRRAFGDDADLVLRVTYLGDAAREALFGGEEGGAADPAAPEQAGAAAAGEPAAVPADAAVPGQPATATSPSAPAEAASTSEQAVATEQEARPEASAAAETAGIVEQPAATAPQAAASAAAERTAADPAVEPAREADDVPVRRTITRRDVFRVGGPVTIERDERVRGDATVILGPLTVDGEVAGDVVVIAGPLRLGPGAVVRGDITVVAGSLRRASSAELRGAVTQVGLGGVRGWDAGRWFQFGWPGAWPGSGLAGTAMRLFLLALLASGIVLVARGPVEGIARRAGAEPLKAGVVGVLAQMLAVPLLVSGILIAVVSIVGIPLLLLLPFVVMAAGLVMLVGFSGAVLGAGEVVRSRTGVSSSAAYASVWAGVALILLPTLAGEALGLAGGLFRGLGVLLALLGLLLEYAAWTAGLGAFILNRVSSSPSPGASLPVPPAPAPPVAPPAPAPAPAPPAAAPAELPRAEDTAAAPPSPAAPGEPPPAPGAAPPDAKRDEN
ncbi:MAG: polymer-forming cytoskeletal protein [Acidobacteria bacterium]|nr:polymer-forming cytoskeletal protein [Acidobacteriota bacterium]